MMKKFCFTAAIGFTLFQWNPVYASDMGKQFEYILDGQDGENGQDGGHGEDGGFGLLKGGNGGNGGKG